jgi:hypothetical protein
MQFNPIKKTVYTDAGEFVKQMHCPYKMQWDQLEAAGGAYRKCSNCNHLIVDTGALSDHELLEMVRQQPDTCLKIDLNQPNLKIINHGSI